MERVTTVDTELAGVVLPAGTSVVPMSYSANYDGALIAEPDKLDLTRIPEPHFAFGHGVHRCIGAPLARLELHAGFATLFRRLPELRPAGPESSLRWKEALLTVGPVALPVVW